MGFFGALLLGGLLGFLLPLGVIVGAAFAAALPRKSWNWKNTLFVAGIGGAIGLVLGVFGFLLTLLAR